MPENNHQQPQTHMTKQQAAALKKKKEKQLAAYKKRLKQQQKEKEKQQKILAKQQKKERQAAQKKQTVQKQDASAQKAGHKPQQNERHAPLFDLKSSVVPRAQRGQAGANQIVLPVIPQKKPTQRNGQVTPQEAARIRRKRMARRRLIAFGTLAVLVLSGILLSFSVLFKVNSYVVEGDTVYSKEELVAAFGVPVGDNLFGFSAENAQQRILDTLPYVLTVKVGRRLPSTVVLKVTGAAEKYAVQTPTAWAVLSESMRILRLSDAQPEGVAVIYGLADVNDCVAGQMFTPPDETQADTLAQLITAIGNSSINNMTAIDITDGLNICVVYAGRVRIKLGTTNELEYKMKLASSILLNEDGKGISESERGVLDVSARNSDGQGQAVWRAGDI